MSKFLSHSANGDELSPISRLKSTNVVRRVGSAEYKLEGVHSRLFHVNFFFPPSGRVPGYLNYLPDVLAHPPIAQCLNASLDALAMTSLANMSNSIDNQSI